MRVGDPPPENVNVIVFGPAGADAGTTKVVPAGIFPSELVVIVAGDVVTGVPSNEIVTVLEGGKDAPVTVTVVPAKPVLG